MRQVDCYPHPYPYPHPTPTPTPAPAPTPNRRVVRQVEGNSQLREQRDGAAERLRACGEAEGVSAGRRHRLPCVSSGGCVCKAREPRSMAEHLAELVDSAEHLRRGGRPR